MTASAGSAASGLGLAAAAHADGAVDAAAVAAAVEVAAAEPAALGDGDAELEHAPTTTANRAVRARYRCVLMLLGAPFEISMGLLSGGRPYVPRTWPTSSH